MFKTGLVLVFWILQSKIIAPLPQNQYVAWQSNVSTVERLPPNSDVNFSPPEEQRVVNILPKKKEYVLIFNPTQQPYAKSQFLPLNNLATGNAAPFPFPDGNNNSWQKNSAFNNSASNDPVIFLSQNLNLTAAPSTGADSFPTMKLDPVQSLPLRPAIILLPPHNSAISVDGRIPSSSLTDISNSFQLANVHARLLNASSAAMIRFPIENQRSAATRVAAPHSPKNDVEVFKPIPDPEAARPAPPPPPAVPIPGDYPAVYYPNFELQPPYFPLGSPTLTPYFPTQPPSFVPRYPPVTSVPPPKPSSSRQTEETTRPTEETTPSTFSKTTPFAPKNNTSYAPPYVPKYFPQNTAYDEPKDIPILPKSTPYRPYYTPYFTKNTPYFNLYTRTSKIPNISLPISPSYAAPAATAVNILPNFRHLTPNAADLISETSATTTPAVEIIGNPSEIDPKFKLAVVSDYRNYNSKDGTFGFSIDLENGLTAKVRGYVKNGKHVIEGSYSLFANEGEPVNITYVADNDELKREQDRSEITISDDTISATNDSLLLTTTPASNS